MAALVLSGARENVQDLARNEVNERAEKWRFAGAIAAGILVGAVAAFLVGGLAGMDETGSTQVTVHSVSAP